MQHNDDLIGACQNWEAPFYKFLHTHLPEHRSAYIPSALLDVVKLAEDLGITKQATYVWLGRGKFPPNRMMALINLPGSTLTVDLLVPFAAFKG